MLQWLATILCWYLDADIVRKHDKIICAGLHIRRQMKRYGSRLPHVSPSPISAALDSVRLARQRQERLSAAEYELRLAREDLADAHARLSQLQTQLAAN